ncbi:DUF2945 domain-containing protein [Dactylosporangium sp. CA-152071]|uniref:DUF2945 domain-containing protein n=1 Tax=Dactylosporangium sp. CA-152071 TaxID=3239933 RepID=UPI003D918D2A
MKRGDKVRWRSHGKTVNGTVIRRITGRTQVAGRAVAASEREPQFVVRSDETGREAVHKPEALN